MPAHRVVPDKTELRRMIEHGLTDQEIADLVFERSGQKVTRQAVTMATARYGLKERRPRYDELLPWRVKTEHLKSWDARMLRAAARRRRGGALSEADEKKLDSWLTHLNEENATVLYDVDLGFVWAERLEGEDISSAREIG